MLAEKCELGTKSQRAKAEKILGLAFNLLPSRPSPIDFLDVLVGLKVAKYIWKGVLKEEQIVINDESSLDSFIQECFGAFDNDARPEIKQKRK